MKCDCTDGITNPRFTHNELLIHSTPCLSFWRGSHFFAEETGPNHCASITCTPHYLVCGRVNKSIYFSITWCLIEIPNSGLGVETGYTQKYLVVLPEITVRNSISLNQSRSISVASFSVRNISFGSVHWCSWHSYAVNVAVLKLEWHRIWPGKERDGMGADSTDWCPRWLSSDYERKFLQNIPPSFLRSHSHIYHKTITPVFTAVQDPFFIRQISFVTFRWLARRIKLAHSASRLLKRCRRQVVMSGTKSSTVWHIMEKKIDSTHWFCLAMKFGFFSGISELSE
jgi:hypothetical protein